MPGPRNKLKKAVLASAIGLAMANANAEAVPRGKIRLALDDVISSRSETESATNFDGRLAFNGLIQSHPDPLYLALEKRYEALPPFTMAEEEIPGQLIAEATLRDRIVDRVQEFSGEVRRFVPKITSSIRQDDISASGDDDTSNLLVSVNPTFRYTHDRRKWNLTATYDYNRRRYLDNQKTTLNDHTVNVDYKLKINRESEFSASSIVARTHDRNGQDPIEDFDSTLQSEELQQNRRLVNVAYRRGSPKDRSRYNLYYTTEASDVDTPDVFSEGYSLDRQSMGGEFAWQARRQLAWVAEGHYQHFDYDGRFLDNNHYRALAGPDLIFGRRIRARIRVGYEGKKFDGDVANASIQESVWRGSMEWALRRKTTVKFETGREVYEVASTEQLKDAEQFNVRDWITTGWSEAWSDKLSTEASYTYRDTSVIGGTGGSDKAQQLVISAAYRLSDKLKFVLDGAFTRHDSTLRNDLIRRTLTFRTDYSL
ncbi:MAG: outer membrane beta-barrel protein [Gammaproteobacteria bacterium]|nr:outer membrane beta-barrel protein [Gammaproteobacteria bacterium]